MAFLLFQVIRRSIVGLGTDEESLTRVIVSRAEIDMKKVKEEYKSHDGYQRRQRRHFRILQFHLAHSSRP
jgi:hypothetical protein